MKKTRNVLMLAALVSISILMSCGGGGGGPGLTDGEKLIEVLTSSTWTVNGTSTSVSSVTGGGNLDVESFQVSFTASAMTVTYALDGDIDTYITGGTFVVTDDADIESPTANATAGLSATVSSISVNSAQDQVTIALDVIESSSAREIGIGSYTLVFEI